MVIFLNFPRAVPFISEPSHTKQRKEENRREQQADRKTPKHLAETIKAADQQKRPTNKLRRNHLPLWTLLCAIATFILLLKSSPPFDSLRFYSLLFTSFRFFLLPSICFLPSPASFSLASLFSV